MKLALSAFRNVLDDLAANSRRTLSGRENTSCQRTRQKKKHRISSAKEWNGPVPRNSQGVHSGSNLANKQEVGYEKRLYDRK